MRPTIVLLALPFGALVSRPCLAQEYHATTSFTTTAPGTHADSMLPNALREVTGLAFAGAIVIPHRVMRVRLQLQTDPADSASGRSPFPIDSSAADSSSHAGIRTAQRAAQVAYRLQGEKEKVKVVEIILLHTSSATARIYSIASKDLASQ